MNSRRRFLKQSTAVALGAFPVLAYRGAMAAETTRTAAEGRILVVIQMSGGNDGINTVVPYADEGYAEYRPRLRLPTDRLIKINDSVGLHPSMRSAADLLEAGKLAIVQGVGYPNPSRSHDTSMAIWHSGQIGDEETVRNHGWIGRAMDSTQGDPNPTSTNDDPKMILLGDESQPMAIQSRRSTAITLSHLTDLRLRTHLPNAHANERPAQEAGELKRFIQQTTYNATAMAISLEQATQPGNSSRASYPATRLGQRLQSVSTLIQCGFRTPVYYTIQDGYDTHAAQLPSHSRLLREFSDAIKAFLADLSRAGLSDRVCVMGFSEFGRRVAENASEGTDHGTSGPVFFAGDQVRPGLMGESPSLQALVDGDLRMSVDFRDVYQQATKNWLGLKMEIEGSSPSPQLQIFV